MWLRNEVSFVGSSIINKDQDKRERLIFETIRDISSDGFLVVDENGVILTINPAYCNFLGVKQADFLGRPVTELIANSKLPYILKTGKQEVNVVDRIILPSGKGEKIEKYVLATRTLVRNQGKVVAAVGQVRFSKETVDLASKFQLVDEELQFYKEELKRITNENYSFKNIVGSSSTLKDVIEVARKAAKSDFHILITGETGTGKEVFAQVIHYHSKRWAKPFIKVNCAAIPAELLESELFGYEEGAFTGAKRKGRYGLFELAHQGTLFLDEIDSLSLEFQGRLLRVLQEGEFMRIGGERMIPVDVRIITATNSNPVTLLAEKRMREDLYYRLNVLYLELPPLRKRKEDIAPMIEQWLQKAKSPFLKGSLLKMQPWLENYSWPGNVRELHNILERVSLYLGDFAEKDYPPEKIFEMIAPQILVERDNQEVLQKEYQTDLKKNEQEWIERALVEEGTLEKAAKSLGVSRSTLWRKLKSFKNEQIVSKMTRFEDRES